MPRIAYLGPEGTFTEAALLRITESGMVPGSGPSDEFTPVPADSTSAALAAVRSGDADYACVPIENSIEGSVLPTLDSLATGPELQVFAELTLDVAFTIVVRSGTTAADVGTVAAFPVASAQVRNWLAANLPKARLVPANSNAAAADDVADGRADAGVSTALAAQRYGLTALASDVVDEPNARTRFVLVGPPGAAAAEHRRGPDVGGVETRQRARGAGIGDDRVRDPRHRPDPHRIPAHPKRVGHLHLLPRLRRAHRRRRRRRGTQGAAPSLCRCAISGVVADGIGRGSGATETRRGERLVEPAAGRQPMSGRLVLVRHGQSHGNVDRRLDTRPPGTELTDLGREQARTFAHDWPHEIGDGRAFDRGARRRRPPPRSARRSSLDPHELEGIHEVQVGDLEDRNDDAAIEEFNAIYQRWHEGELDLRMPAGESATQVLDSYVPVITQLRMRYLDDDAWHRDIIVVSHGAAIRLAAATLAGVDGSFALDHHLPNTESVVLTPITDGRWSCLHWGPKAPPFYPEPDVHPVEDALSSADPMG